MKVVIAPDSFKESLSAAQACAAMAGGVARVWPQAEVLLCPMADGGEGTVSVLTAALGASLVEVATTDALGRGIVARYARHGELAIVEAAQAVGLELIATDDRDLWHSTTGGLAAVLADAVGAGARRIVITVGGTATCDGGAGLLVGLGARLLDAEGVEVSPDPAGLERAVRLDASLLPSWLAEVSLELAADVANPLLGPTGAAAVFAPQKGATVEQVPALERVLSRWAGLLVDAGLGDVAARASSGCGGGLGAALLALGAVRRSGAELVADVVGLPAAIEGADLVLTGEGRIDAQTASGKVISVVARLAGAHRVPVVAFAGSSEPGAAEALGLVEAVVIAPAGMSIAQAIAEAPQLLTEAVAARLARERSRLG